MDSIFENEITLTTPELLKLRFNKQDSYNYRFRREQDWRENYTLYRDKVTYNRLTQRQSVNLPLMKTHLRTLLKNIDDMPIIEFEHLDNDKQAETFLNEYWKLTVIDNNMETQDVVDKKQDLFFGRTFDQMQIMDGKVSITVIDPEDILVNRYINPTNIDNGRFLIHTHIFVPLSSLEEDEENDPDAIKRLKMFYATQQGLIKSKQNLDLLILKNRKLADLGVLDVDEPTLGETYVELSLHFIYNKEETDDKEQLYYYKECDALEILQKKRLEEKIGTTKDHYWQNHFPYNSWADDVDIQDFWTDGVADIIRTPNKVLNTWFSQMVENRSLKSLNMNFFDGTKEGFVPQTWEPKAWGMYPTPGKPSDIMMPIPVGDLSDSLNEIQFVQDMIESATGATATQQGQTQNDVTLGDIKLSLVEATQRVQGMSKFYTKVWKDRATKFLKLIEAAPEKIDAVRIYKKGRMTDKIFSRMTEPKDWKLEAGYQVKVWAQDDKDTQDTQKLQKLNAAMMSMPGNKKLTEIYDRKLLEFADLNPEEINEIMDEQQQLLQQSMNPMGMPGQPAQPGMPGMPGQPQPPVPPLALPPGAQPGLPNQGGGVPQ